MREARFLHDPIAPQRPAGSEYGWVSPFIIEVRISLELEPEQLPSKDAKIIPKIVEKAAAGIIEEGKKDNKFEAAANESDPAKTDPNSLHLLARAYDLDRCDLDLFFHYGRYFSRRANDTDLIHCDRDGIVNLKK
ncbi:unnamed protein product [Rotaria sordida]|uniref:Uncharacterized protein n=1 Tax=Rotaria sordida TaxID=392033 RepID=A0A814VFB6_9BILA|nr:unnamed protein product [Rotaria sordida]CAF3644827.1 unnamed protein product [Rotaria sordida]